jgi:3-oxoacyl-[acyl-carrier protein] reductase
METSRSSARTVEIFAGPLGALISGLVVRIDGSGQLWPV